MAIPIIIKCFIFHLPLFLDVAKDGQGLLKQMIKCLEKKIGK